MSLPSKSFKHSEFGATLIEYVLLILLVVLLAVPAISFFGGEVTNSYEDTGEAFYNNTFIGIEPGGGGNSAGSNPGGGTTS